MSYSSAAGASTARREHSAIAVALTQDGAPANVTIGRVRTDSSDSSVSGSLKGAKGMEFLVDLNDEQSLLEHKNPFEYEGLDCDNWKDRPFVQPNTGLSIIHYFRQIFRNGMFAITSPIACIYCAIMQAYAGVSPLWSTTVDDLSELGVGISLHFRILRYTGCFFVLATILAIPVLYFAMEGDRFGAGETDPLRLSKLSVGNLSPLAAVSNATITTNAPLSISITSRTLSWLFVVFDVLLVAGFLLYFCFVRRSLNRLSNSIQSTVTTVEDYSVMVTGLPKDATEAEIREHFDSRYNLYKEDWTYASNCSSCYAGRKMFRRKTLQPVRDTAHIRKHLYNVDRLAPYIYQDVAASEAIETTLFDEDVYPVVETSNTGKPEYAESWIAEVSVARANGHALKYYAQQQHLIERIRGARATVKVLYEAKRTARKGLGRYTEVQHKNALLRLENLEKRLDAIHEAIQSSLNNDVVGAFVVFQAEESAKRCIEDYSGSDSYFSVGGFWCQPAHLRFRGKHKLSVSKAPSPTEVIWENLDLTTRGRCVRQTGVNLLALLLLLVSFFAIILMQAQQNKLRKYAPASNMCTSVIPGLAYGVPFTEAGETPTGYSLPSGVSYTAVNDGVCADGFLHLQINNTQGATRVTSPNNPNTCLNECIDPDAVCSTRSFNNVNISIPVVYFQSCFCAEKLAKAFRTANIAVLWDLANDETGGFCTAYVYNYIAYNTYLVATAVSIIIINIVLRVFFTRSATWEGHATTKHMYILTTVKVFAAMLINTAGIILLINASLPEPASSWRLGDSDVFIGTFKSMSALWHASVGSKIVLTMLINTFSPHVPLLLHYIRLACCCCCCCCSRERTAVTQYELDKRYQPVNFNVPVRTAVTMNTTWVCFLYSGGHPLLLAVAAFSMFVTYCVDKWAILRAARKPPVYDATIAKVLVELMPVLAMLHLAMTIWMYSDESVFYSPSITAALRSGSDNAFLQDIGISEWLPTQRPDSTGLRIVERITRENTAPLFLLMLVIGAFTLSVHCLPRCVRLSSFIGRWLSFGNCGDVTGVQLPGSDHFPDFKNVSPFTGPFRLPLRQGTNFTKKLGDSKNPIAKQLAVDPRGRRYQIYTWAGEGEAYGTTHEEGQRLLTWQVIEKSGHIPSYNIAANPRYAPAVAALRAGHKKHKQRRQTVAAAPAAAVKSPLVIVDIDTPSNSTTPFFATAEMEDSRTLSTITARQEKIKQVATPRTAQVAAIARDVGAIMVEEVGHDEEEEAEKQREKERAHRDRQRKERKQQERSTPHESEAREVRTEEVIVELTPVEDSIPRQSRSRTKFQTAAPRPPSKEAIERSKQYLRDRKMRQSRSARASEGQQGWETDDGHLQTARRDRRRHDDTRRSNSLVDQRRSAPREVVEDRKPRKSRGAESISAPFTVLSAEKPTRQKGSERPTRSSRGDYDGRSEYSEHSKPTNNRKERSFQSDASVDLDAAPQTQVSSRSKPPPTPKETRSTPDISRESPRVPTPGVSEAPSRLQKLMSRASSRVSSPIVAADADDKAREPSMLKKLTSKMSSRLSSPGPKDTMVAVVNADKPRGTLRATPSMMAMNASFRASIGTDLPQDARTEAIGKFHQRLMDRTKSKARMSMGLPTLREKNEVFISPPVSTRASPVVVERTLSPAEDIKRARSGGDPKSRKREETLYNDDLMMPRSPPPLKESRPSSPHKKQRPHAKVGTIDAYFAAESAAMVGPERPVQTHMPSFRVSDSFRVSEGAVKRAASRPRVLSNPSDDEEMMSPMPSPVFRTSPSMRASDIHELARQYKEAMDQRRASKR